jgi:hypothetical protein
MLKYAMLVAALSGALLAAPCMAHAKLQSSSPANAAQLTEPPKTLTLQFNEAAKVAVLKLLNDGKETSIAIDKHAKASQSFTFPLPALAAGNYTVQWTAVSADDGHVTKGSFAFSIKG